MSDKLLSSSIKAHINWNRVETSKDDDDIFFHEGETTYWQYAIVTAYESFDSLVSFFWFGSSLSCTQKNTRESFHFFPQDMKESESSPSSLRHLALYWRALFPFSAARLLYTRRQPYFLSFFLSMLWICYALVTSYPPPLLPPTSSSAETPIPHIFGSREETIGAWNVNKS